MLRMPKSPSAAHKIYGYVKKHRYVERMHAFHRKWVGSRYLAAGK